MLSFALFPTLAKAEAQAHDDRLVKAAFVYNLTKYVEWPDLRQEIVIGFVGDDSTGEMLRAMLNGRTSESRMIRVVLSPQGQDLEQCNLVYIAGVSRDKLRAALNRVPKKGVLTVGDADSFINTGGMVGLVTEGDHVQIQVNLQSAREAGLKISSRLLSIAVVTQTGSGSD